MGLIVLAACTAITPISALDLEWGGTCAVDGADADVLDLASVSSDLKGYSGGFHDGTYGYFAPYSNGALGWFGKVVRFSLGSFDNAQVLNLMDTSPNLRGFTCGFHDGLYGYVLPYGAHGSGNSYQWFKVGRFDLATFSQVEALDLSATSPLLNGYAGGFKDSAYGYLIPRTKAVNSASGYLTRFRLTTFSNVEVLNLEALDSDLKGFNGGFQDGTYGYAVPQGGVYTQPDRGKLTRFVLATFSQVQVLDLEAINAELVQFVGGFSQGEYGYLVPYDNRKAVRFDLATFTQVQVLDLANHDSGLRYFSGGFADNSYGYLLPGANTRLARFDLTTFSKVHWVDLGTSDADLGTYSRGFHDGSYGYLAPYNHGKALRFGIMSSPIAAENCSAADSCRYCRDGAVAILDPEVPGRVVEGGGHCVLAQNSSNSSSTPTCIDIYTRRPCKADNAACPTSTSNPPPDPEYLEPVWYHTCSDGFRKVVQGPAGCNVPGVCAR